MHFIQNNLKASLEEAKRQNNLENVLDFEISLEELSNCTDEIIKNTGELNVMENSLETIVSSPDALSSEVEVAMENIKYSYNRLGLSESDLAVVREGFRETYESSLVDFMGTAKFVIKSIIEFIKKAVDYVIELFKKIFNYFTRNVDKLKERAEHCQKAINDGNVSRYKSHSDDEFNNHFKLYALLGNGSSSTIDSVIMGYIDKLYSKDSEGVRLTDALVKITKDMTTFNGKLITDFWTSFGDRQKWEKVANGVEAILNKESNKHDYFLSIQNLAKDYVRKIEGPLYEVCKTTLVGDNDNHIHFVLGIANNKVLLGKIPTKIERDKNLNAHHVADDSVGDYDHFQYFRSEDVDVSAATVKHGFNIGGYKDAYALSSLAKEVVGFLDDTKTRIDTLDKLIKEHDKLLKDYQLQQERVGSLLEKTSYNLKRQEQLDIANLFSKGPKGSELFKKASDLVKQNRDFIRKVSLPLLNNITSKYVKYMFYTARDITEMLEWLAGSVDKGSLSTITRKSTSTAVVEPVHHAEVID